MGTEKTWHRRIAERISDLENGPGFPVNLLFPGDILKLRTAYEYYLFSVVDPKEGTVVVLESDGRWIRQQVSGKILGSNILGEGSALYGGRIAVGFRLELHLDRWLPHPDRDLFREKRIRPYVLFLRDIVRHFLKFRRILSPWNLMYCGHTNIVRRFWGFDRLLLAPITEVWINAERIA